MFSRLFACLFLPRFFRFALSVPLILFAGSGVRKVLMQAPKNGFFYVLDRQTGKLINADAYVPLLGQPEAFANWKEFAFFENHLNLGLDDAERSKVSAEELAEHPEISVRISAWDPVARKEVFRIDSGSAWNAGVLSTAGKMSRGNIL